MGNDHTLYNKEFVINDNSWTNRYTEMECKCCYQDSGFFVRTYIIGSFVSGSLMVICDECKKECSDDINEPCKKLINRLINDIRF